MDTITGFIEHIIFRNQENGYTVFNLQTDTEEITCVGNIETLDAGETVELQGTFVEHSLYGRQFKTDFCRFLMPSDEVSIKRYLGSGAIKGIGEALAARIVNKFKEDTFRIIEEEPERLAEIKGISERKAREISLQLEEKSGMREAMIFLQHYGISNALAVKIYETYQMETYQILQENPYRLAEDIEGVGFRTADEIASRIGIHTDSDFRIRSGLLYTLQRAGGEGHLYLPQQQLLVRAVELLGVAAEDIRPQLSNLAMEQKLVMKLEEGQEEPFVYSAQAYYAELSCARMLADLGGPLYGEEEAGRQERERVCRRLEQQERYVSRRTEKIAEDAAGSTGGWKAAGRGVDKAGADGAADRGVDKAGADGAAGWEADSAGSGPAAVELDELQKKAVAEGALNGVFILTGGPGTGKTTTINAIIRYFVSEQMDILLAAPTGRAAKRMTEATGYEARTIHRLLEVNGGSSLDGEKRGRFERNEANPLEADVIIVDEMSMVDIYLFQSLLRAILPGTRLILVGDVNQLPSVGPGQVLRDLIASGAFPVVRLQKIFRQAEESDIVVNAHKIHRGEQIALTNRSRDFFFLERDNVQVIYKHMIQLIQEKLPPYVNASPFDIQVLTPMRKGNLGACVLNQILQRYLNPASKEKAEHTYGETLFRVGDKVMQIRNNYQLEWEIVSRYHIPVDQGTGVFNGDLGLIREISEASQSMLVEFDEHRLVRYPFAQLDELELAYAVTIHKSQGSEYPAVILPLLTGPRLLFNRNLLYTGITRARSCVTILGSSRTVWDMIANESENKRYTSLDKRIREVERRE